MGRLAIPLVTVAVAIAAGIGASSAIESRGGTTTSRPAPPFAPTPSPREGPAPERPRELGGSLYGPASFRRALAIVRTRSGPGAGVLILRLDPEQLVAQMSDGRSQDIVVVRRQGSVLSNHVDSPGGGLPRFRLSSVDPAVPQRLLAAIRRRTGVPYRRVSYMVMTAAGGRTGPYWLAYLTGSARHFRADARGRGLEVFG